MDLGETHQQTTAQKFSIQTKLCMDLGETHQALTAHPPFNILVKIIILCGSIKQAHPIMIQV
jgi:hypothetical protein